MVRADAVLIGGLATGPAGSAVEVEVSLETGGAVVNATQNDLGFDVVHAPINALANGKPDCVVNPEINKESTAFSFQPPGCVGMACTAVRTAVISFAHVNDPIPDGAWLYRCNVQISPSAPVGTYSMPMSNLDVTAPGPVTLPSSAVNALVTVVNVSTLPTQPCVGDANGDSVVSIAEVQQAVASFLIGCPLLKDDGDGTVTDTLTGLMWEKKTHDGTLHDVSSTYQWTGTGDSQPTGTLFSVFLSGLNGGATGVGNCQSPDGTAQTGGFAGHCDWRLPTVAELRTILLAPSPCSVMPCVDQVTFGPTVASAYWSSTSSTNFTEVWTVNFHDGSVGERLKSASQAAVRAVRGGVAGNNTAALPAATPTPGVF